MNSVSKKGTRTLFITLASIAFLFVLMAVLTPVIEKSMLYHPSRFPDGNWNPDEQGLKVEEVWFNSKDGTKLHSWFAPAPDAQATMLWFHGNAGNLSHRLDNMLQLKPLNLNIFIFDYRGYGKSEGSPSHDGLSQDSQAAYDWLVAQPGISPDQLVLFGRSLGGVFASEVADNNPAAGLILESTFTNVRDMARQVIPWFPAHWFLKSTFDSEARLKQNSIPKLFLHGTEDEIIPYKLGRKLFNSAAEPKTFYDVRGASHNDTVEIGGVNYFKTLETFIQQTTQSRDTQKS